jgi:hypothetical protein
MKEEIDMSEMEENLLLGLRFLGWLNRDLVL